MRVFEWVAEQVTGMSAGDRAAWASVRTLADQGEVTAQWLEGTVGSQPDYHYPCDVDEEDVPGMAATLAAVNRAGFVTTQSQAAFDGTGYDGEHWQQRAAVTGFADDTGTAWLTEALDGTGVVVEERQTRRLWEPAVVPVTCRDGNTYTDFGGREPTDAVTADANQLVVYDPEWGRNDRLWPALDAATDQQTQIDHDEDGM